jgi:hypothetical protein
MVDASDSENDEEPPDPPKYVPPHKMAKQGKGKGKGKALFGGTAMEKIGKAWAESGFKRSGAPISAVADVLKVEVAKISSWIDRNAKSYLKDHKELFAKGSTPTAERARKQEEGRQKRHGVRFWRFWMTCWCACGCDLVLFPRLPQVASATSFDTYFLYGITPSKGFPLKDNLCKLQSWFLQIHLARMRL